MHRKILFTLAALAFMATTPAAADGYRDMVKQLIATSSGGFGTVITQLKTMQADEQVKGKGETTWLLDSDFERYLDSQYADDMTDLYLPCYRDNMTEGQLRELIEYNSRPEVKAAANHVASMTQQVTTDVALMAVSWIKAYKDGKGPKLPAEAECSDEYRQKFEDYWNAYSGMGQAGEALNDTTGQTDNAAENETMNKVGPLIPKATKTLMLNSFVKNISESELDALTGLINTDAHRAGLNVAACVKSSHLDLLDELKHRFEAWKGRRR